MKKDIKDVIKDATLPNRLVIVKLLKDDVNRISELKRRLKEREQMPVSTVYRSVNSLAKAGLVTRDGDKVSLTSAGLLLADAVECLDSLINFDYINTAIDFLLSIPSDLRFGLKYLTECDVVDLTTMGNFTLEFIRSIRKGGLYIDRVVDKEIYKLMIQKRMNGVFERVISSEDTLYPRIETEIQALKELGLSKEEINKVWQNVDLRVMDLPIQMGIIDGKYGAIMLMKGDTFTPFFVSEKRDMVRWLENIFNYYWEVADTVDVYFDGGINGIRKKIVESV
jgi:predicted transcriptional regulator